MAVQVAVFFCIWIVDRASPEAVILGWGAGAVMGAIVGLRMQSGSYSWPGVREWFAHSRSLSGWMAAQVLVSQLGGQATVLGISAVVGLSALGHLRASQTLLAPLAVVLAVASTIMLPELAAYSRDHLDRLRWAVRRVAVASLIGSGIYASAVLLTDGMLLPSIFGRAFAEGTDLVFPIALAAVAQALAVSPGLGSRALAQGRAVFATQVTATVVGLPVILFLGWRLGMHGAAWGFCAQSVVLCAASWLTYTNALRTQERVATVP
jgi:O-antigen/teichoic acid export membrane protein